MNKLLPLWLALPLSLAAQAPVVHRGALARGDQTLTSGEFYDEYTFAGRAGQRVSVDLTSSAFDPYVMVIAPSGRKEENDDWQGSTSRARLELTLAETGTYRVLVTTYKADEAGAYELRIDTAGDGAATAQGGGRVETGRLAAGDRTLRSGEYYDEFPFAGEAGRRVVVDLTGTGFDPYVMVIAPSGDKQENDDWQGSSSRARLELTLTETGTFRVIVTSYAKDETGSYELRIDTGAVAAVAAEPGVRVENGRLAAGDRTLRSGEYFDEYTLAGRRGDALTVDLRASEFDPYIIVTAPSGKQEENDDYEGDAHRSLVTFTLPEDGTYRIMVTSYQKDETGAYVLRIQQGTGGAATAAGGGAVPGPRVERGRLAAGDDSLRSGEYVDLYTFEGRPGQHVTLDVVSQDFDTYLILLPPRGERRENDDVEGRPRHSVIEADLTEAGTYQVAVTSYQKGETGGYELRIDFRGASAPAAGAPAGAAGGSRDVTAIAYGDTKAGQLTDGDGRLESGEYRDLYAFEGAVGDQITIELASTAFDPYLILTPPEGEQIDNDDADGRQDLSRISLTLRAAGRYRIFATSYASGKTGAYQLTLRRGGGAVAAGRPGPPAPAGAARAGGAPRVYGVFVGISNYGGRASNLMFTADDARRTQAAMIRGAGMREADGVVLVDQQATLANIRRAVENVARQAGPNDMFVFFYSGHGGRVPRRGGFQATDPDNQDETLAFYDADLTDDEMSQWLAGIRARVSLLVLDACFSGGFSKDVISAPGRMGLFSSEEDVTSGVAVKFRAGGYLAQFLAEAVGERLADADGDREITALELSQYLHERYRADVKSGGPGEDFVRTGGPQTGYQHLVVDRGSIGPYDVLFR
jgi:hypothetical protein